MKRLIYILAALAVTWWQVKAGFARCGTVDGGVLLAPLVVMAVALVKGVTHDLHEAFSGTSPQRREIGG